MRILCIQHVAHEGPGSIAEWARQRGHDLQIEPLWEVWDRLPSRSQEMGDRHPCRSSDMLVLMGGPMSANDEDQHPWLREEKQLIRQTIAEGKHILGICLGAQLIAAALDTPVYRAAEPEIGWFDVEAVDAAAATALALPARHETFHWHGETFDLPAGAKHLAQSAACRNQAFLHGARTLAIQFHPEVTPETIAAMIEYEGKSIGCGKYEQPPVRLTRPPTQFSAQKALFFEVLDRFTAR